MNVPRQNPPVTDAAPDPQPAPAAGEAPARPGSPEARRLAAAILEVLAGLRGPAEAARTLGISLARYYQVERRALDGLLAGCEPRRRCRGQRGPGELAALRLECARLRRECARQQALVRAAHCTVGLTPPPPAPAAAPETPKGDRKRRTRRPRARALRMAAQLREETRREPPSPAALDTTAASEVDKQRAEGGGIEPGR